MTGRPTLDRDLAELLARDARAASDSYAEALLALRVAYAEIARERGLQLSAVDDRMDKERRFQRRAQQ